MESKEIYKDMPWIAQYLQLAQMWLDPIRQIGWWILIGLGKVLDTIFEAYLKLIQINIYDMIASSLGRVIKGIEDLWPLVLTLSITIMGIIIMITSKKRKDFGNGLAVAVLLLICGPMLFSTFNSFLKASVPWVESAFGTYETEVVYDYGASGHPSTIQDKYSTKISSQIIGKSTYDLLSSAQSKTMLTVYTPERININERMGGYFGHEDLFAYKVDNIGADGKVYGRELTDDAWVMKDQLNDGLYRYHFDFFVPFFTMIILIIGISLGAFKTAKLMFELVFSQTLAPIVFASDLTNAGRSKEVIKKILSTYVLITIVFYGLMLFMTLSLWALGQENVIVRIFLLAGFAWGMIDGPDIVVRLLGIDAGVRSGFAAVLGAGMVVGGAARLTRGAANIARAGSGVVSRIADRARTQTKAPSEVRQALNGSTAQSKRAFHDKNSSAYHNTEALNYKDDYKPYRASRSTSKGNTYPDPNGEIEREGFRGNSFRQTGESTPPTHGVNSKGQLTGQPEARNQTAAPRSINREWDKLKKIKGTDIPAPPPIDWEGTEPPKSVEPDTPTPRRETQKNPGSPPSLPPKPKPRRNNP